MANIFWTGSDGDWSDPTNWDGGTIPTTQDTAEFAAGSSEIISGSAYIGTMSLNGANVTLAGDFSGDGQFPAFITDETISPGSTATLAIAAWASVTLDSISLSSTSLFVQGGFADNSGTLENATVDGSSAGWFSGETTILGTLAVQNGGLLDGNVSLVSGASILCDTMSTIEGGTITAQGNNLIDFINSDGDQSSSVTLNEGIAIAQGANLSIAAPGSVSIELNGALSGSGILNISDTNLMLGPLCTIGGNLMLANSALNVNGAVAQPGATVTMSGSLLDIQSEPAQQTTLNVIASSGDNTVQGGKGNLAINADGSYALEFSGGSGNATITAGTSMLRVMGGSGAEDIYCGSSGADSVQIGAGTAKVYATAGTTVGVAGSGNNIVKAGDGNEMIDGRASHGNNEYYGGSGDGTTSIYGGSGSDTILGGSAAILAIAGNGAENIWGGTSGHDTITGGLGADTLFGGTGATLTAVGNSPNLLGTYLTTSGALINISQSSGKDSVFAAGASGTVTVIGGTGNDLIVGGKCAILVECGSGSSTVFSGTGLNDTIIGGGGGNNILLGGTSSHITLTGASQNITVTYGAGGSVVDATASGGSDTIFASGTGVTSVLGGTGNEVVVGSTSRLFVVGGSGAFQVWGGYGGYDTILGGGGNNTLVGSSHSDIMASGYGSNILVAEGTNAILDTSKSHGYNELFLSRGFATFVTAGSGQNIIIGSDGSAQINIDAGHDTIWAGAESLSMNILPSDLTGTLDIHQFNIAQDQITLSDANYSVSEESGNTIIMAGLEKIIIHDVSMLADNNIVIAQH